MFAVDDILAEFDGINEIIASFRIYLKNIYAVKRFSFGTWTSRQHLILAVKAEGKTGYAESIISVNQPDVPLHNLEEWSGELAGLSVTAALKKLRGQRGVWAEHYVEMTEMALIDLAGKLKGRPALDMLGLMERKPVHGVFVILSDDLEDVAQKARWAAENGRSRFIKVKLFGSNGLDCDIIKTVRACAGDGEVYLIGDVNGGYCMPGKAVFVKDIAEDLKRLRDAGLDACEDPAYLDLGQWVALQASVGTLSLIPDYPLRPSRKAIHEIVPGMGRIYNIHPDSAGSIVDAIALAGRIKELGASLMVGDDSLVGPSATIWQQLAIGLGAAWVEATEKTGESDFYYRAVKQIPTDSRKNPISIECGSGFGIELDEGILEQEADRILEVSG